MAEELSQRELDERVAILKRFRALLEQQRSKFKEYLAVLESQHGKIEAEDEESLTVHAELGNQIVKNIASLQKVIVPMQRLYQSKGWLADSSKSVLRIQDELNVLREKVLVQNEKNRALLQSKMGQVRTQLNAISRLNPYFGNRSVYSERSATGNVISVSG